MLLRQVFLIFSLLLVAGCASRPQVELELVRSEVAKAYARGAKVLAAPAYDAASAALHDAERLVSLGRYSRARGVLNRGLIHAAKASAVAQEKAIELEKQYRHDIEAKASANNKIPALVKKKTVAVKPKSKPEQLKPEIVFLDQVTVSVGETLFSLSSRSDIYGEPFLWPLIYRANRDQIKDPRQIFEGQLFTIPRDKTEPELEAARREARESDLFPH